MMDFVMTHWEALAVSTLLLASILLGWRRWRLSKVKVGPLELEPVTEQKSPVGAGTKVDVQFTSNQIGGSVGNVGVVTQGGAGKPPSES